MSAAINIKSNQRPSICSMCAGACCKRMPGICHPLEMKIDKDILRELLQGDYILDYWEDEYPLYYLRPKTLTEKERKEWVNGSWGGVCSLLTPTGCELKFKDRPHGCKSLVPKANMECTTKGIGKLGYAELWMKHHGKIIKELVNEYYDKFK